MTEPVYNDPRWQVAEEHQDANGTWTQHWKMTDAEGKVHSRQASGISARARTTHPPEDVI